MGLKPKVRWLVGPMVLAMLAGLVGPAEAAPPAKPVFTSPTNGQHLSIVRDDGDPNVAGFQITVTGTSAPNAAIDLNVKRPGGTATDFGTATANGAGAWSVAGSLAAGEWVFVATAEVNDETSEAAEAAVSIVMRYVFTWYDDKNSFHNWVMVGNPNSTTATAEIFIAGKQRGGKLTIPAGQAATVVFPKLIGGPVVVDSLDGVPLLVTQRTLWTVDDFEEVEGVFDGHLTTNNWFTWYDTKNTSGRDWIVATNFGSGTTTIQLRIAGFLVDQKSVQKGKSAVFNVANIAAGPIQLTATQPFLASRRTLWRTGNFTELVGIPDRWLEKTHYFPWFDAVNTQNRDWIMIANPNSTQLSASIVRPGSANPDTFNVAAGGTVFRQYPGLIGGPIVVNTSQPAVVTQRALWSRGQSFEETAGIPFGGLTEVFHQTWYDDKNSRGDWLMQGSIVPDDPDHAPGEGDVDYTITCPSINHSSTVSPGESEFKLFQDQIGGPCRVAGDGFFLHSRRTLWGRDRDFTEMNGLRGSTGTGLGAQLGAVAGLAVTDVPFDDGTALRVSFNTLTGADGYWVYQVGTATRRVLFIPASACTGGTCSGVVSGLATGVQVTFQVRPLSRVTIEGLPAQANGTPLDNPPSAPTWPATGAVAAGEKSLVVDWNDNPENDILGYRVYRASVANTNLCGTQLGPTFPSNAFVLANPGTDPITDPTKPDQVPQPSRFTITGLTNGQAYCVVVAAEDVLNQEGAGSAMRSGTPAAVPPVVTVTAPNGGEKLRGDGPTLFEIKWTDSDPNGDKHVVKIEYSIDGGDNWIVIEDSTPNDGSFMWDVAPVDTIEARVRVTATDQAGNTHADTSNADFAIDSTAPAVSVTTPTAGAIFAGGGNVQVNWTQTDVHPAGFQIAFTTDNGATFTDVSCTEVDDGDSNASTKRCNATAPAANTTQARVRVTVTDQVGHSGAGLSPVFKIDSTAPPTPTISEVNGQVVNPNNAEPHAMGTDSTPRTVVTGGSPFTESGTVKIYRGGQPGSCSSTPVASKAVEANDAQVVFNNGGDSDFTAQAGTNSLWVCMVDSAGNASPVSAQRIVYLLDTTPPSTPVGLTATTAGAGQVFLNWNDATDNAAGVKGYIVYQSADVLNGGLCAGLPDGAYTAIPGNDGLTTTISEFTVQGLTPGDIHCFKVAAVDNVGNVGSRSAAVAGTAG